MITFIAKGLTSRDSVAETKVAALADSGLSASILSYNLGLLLRFELEEPGDATLEDISGINMDISGKAYLTVREEQRHAKRIQVLVSKSLGKEELVLGLMI